MWTTHHVPAGPVWNLAPRADPIPSVHGSTRQPTWLVVARGPRFPPYPDLVEIFGLRSFQADNTSHAVCFS